jgi:tetratricopeptide (TPR) repeat protein
MKLVIAFAFLVSTQAFGEVKAWEEKLVLPTWEIGPSQVHPIFSDGGRDIYPYTLNETLTDRKTEKAYTAVFLENDYVKVLVLPEIGGRLHGAIDKTNGYEFFYWQKTIKPGLISMTGAWISGGIEWNFPHGHRPSGFMPVDHRIVRNADGSATIWVGETEPIFRMRWLVGMTVFPGRSYIRSDYVFINPTEHRHSFQFWATAATYAGDSVQAQYPGDMVTGHGKHEFWNWPIHNGVDLTWWKNVPNASSFFAFNNPSEWFGTYDHQKQAGMVHVGNHHIVLGKKLWTWGSGPSGRIWEEILSDGGPPYYEPQAGVWSDNQPDYHWMAPYEVKTAHDYWYPVRDLRGYHNATRDFAVNTDVRDGKAFAGVNATAIMKDCKVVLKDTRTGSILSQAVATISPDKPYTVEVAAGGEMSVFDLHLAVHDARGKVAIELQQQRPKEVELPEGQKDPGDPKNMSADELYRAGEWLDRFRRTPEALAYYQESLRRDPKDSRVNVEMGFLTLKQGKWQEALRFLNTALSGDSDNARIYYGKGLAYEGLRNYDEAYDSFYRATYSYDQFAAAYLRLGRIDLLRGDYREAIAKFSEAETHNGKSAEIQALKAAAYRHLDDSKGALAAADRALQLDPMHFMGGYEKSLSSKSDVQWLATWKSYMRDAVQNYLELAASYAGAGMYREADDVLALFSTGTDESKLNPMVSYFRGYYKELAGKPSEAAKFYATARTGPTVYTNPHRLEEKAALEAAIRVYPEDANAHLFLGNLLYGMGQREQGMAMWARSAELNPASPLAWRNVGYARGHLKQDLRASYDAYEKAFAADQHDARILLELDDNAEKLKMSSDERLTRLLKHIDVVKQRDDLLVKLVDLRLERGGIEDLRFAYTTLKERHFRSWEGKYGVHAAWVDVNRRLGDIALERKDLQPALSYYRQAAEYPKNLEVAPRTPDFQAHIRWDLARAYTAMGNQEAARQSLQKILEEKYSKPHLGLYYQALAQKTLGDQQNYRATLQKLEAAARERASGQDEHRGRSEMIGHYLLSLVLEEKGEKTEAAEHRKKALLIDPLAARVALLEAQLDTARAHQ